MNCPECKAPLPPDWCGHVGVEDAIAHGQRMLAASEAAADREVTRLRAEITRLREAERILLESENDAHIRAQEAEARLRRIEEAARPILDRCLDFFRAALDAKP